jgi:hypothetical protein
MVFGALVSYTAGDHVVSVLRLLIHSLQTKFSSMFYKMIQTGGAIKKLATLVLVPTFRVLTCSPRAAVSIVFSPCVE